MTCPRRPGPPHHRPSRREGNPRRPDNRRWPSKLLIFTLALPIFTLVYLTTFGGRLAARGHLPGATVISSIYAEEAIKRTPQCCAATAVRRGRALGPAVAPPTAGAERRVTAGAVIGADFRLGTEGPRTFDCSGFSELPCGLRLRAVGYMHDFVARGRFTRDQGSSPVVWKYGSHIGIYLGEGKAISALVNPWGVIHSVRGIRLPVSYYLHVKRGSAEMPAGWVNSGPTRPAAADTPSLRNGNSNGKRSVADDAAPNGQSTDIQHPDTPSARTQRGCLPLGTMNIRAAPDPQARNSWARPAVLKITDQDAPAQQAIWWFKILTVQGGPGSTPAGCSQRPTRPSRRPPPSPGAATRF